MINIIKKDLEIDEALKQSDKDKIINYIEQVNNTNKDYKKVQELSITLSNVDEKLINNRKEIKTLTENNKALNLRVSVLEDKIDKQNKEIEVLKEENSILKASLEYFKNKFRKLINLIKNKMFHKDKEKYSDFSKDLYSHGIIDDSDMKNIKDSHNKDNLSR